MRTPRTQRVAVGLATALLAAAVVGGPVRAGPSSWLAISPASSPIPLEPGGSVTLTVTNTDRRTSSSPLVVALARSPSTAPFAIGADGCTGLVLAPGRSCTVVVHYDGPKPARDERAALTVTSGRPAKASATRVLEVGVSFGDVCQARGGVATQGGSITMLGATFPVGDRCDWGTVLPTAEYNAAFDALAPECVDLGYGGTVGYPATGETGTSAIGCAVG